ncbi:MAG TPA: hypothetical protein VHC97_08250 [Thermoanaerobaculia bacterium]|jgi:hypothetical protein|nr:hypothetical protein [Thermoanaerobaculia bacterium]
MSIEPNPLSVTSPYHPLDILLIGASLEEESGSVVDLSPAAAPMTPPAAVAETVPGLDFQGILRSNLHAAAQHAALGHQAPTFRQCLHGSCRDASNLVPYLVAAELGVTDAELDAMLNRTPAAPPVPDLQEELVLAA